MATRKELETWIERAAAADDGDTVRALLAELDAQPNQQAAPPAEPSPRERQDAIIAEHDRWNRGTDLGLVRGVADIGNVILNAGVGATGIGTKWNQERNAELEALDRQYSDTGYGVTRLLGNIGVTAGIPGAAANALRAIPGLARVAPGLLNALESAGATTGARGIQGFKSGAADIGKRVLGGGVAGGAMTAAVDPEAAGTGAAIGAALPPAIKLVAGTGKAIAAGVRPFTQKGQQQIAAGVMQEAATDPAAAWRALQQSKQIIPGSDPLTSSVAGDIGLSGLTRTMQNASPDMSAALTQRAAQQNAARTAAVESIANPGLIRHAEDARELATAPIRESALKAAGRLESGPVVDALDMMLADPDNAGELVQAALGRIRRSIVRSTSNGEISARALYAIRKDINTAISGKLRGEAGNLVYAKGELTGAKQVIDDAITEAMNRPPAAAARAPGPQVVHQKLDVPALPNEFGQRLLSGPPANALAVQGRAVAKVPTSQADQALNTWKEYLSKYAEMSKPINQMETLQEVLKRAQTGTVDTNGNLILSAAKLNNILKNETKELSKVLTDGQLQLVRNLAADLNASQLGMNAGKAVGSNTVQNLAQDKFLKGALGKLGISSGVKSTLGNLLKIPYYRADQDIMQIVNEGLLNPLEGGRLLGLQRQTPMKVNENALKAAYLAAPVVGSR